MKKHIRINPLKLASFLMIGLLFFLISDCVSEITPPSYTATGSILVRWGSGLLQGQGGFFPLQSNFDCGVNGVETVDAEVYDENGGSLATGGAWDCGDHEGVIYNVEPGDNITVVLMARNAAGDILYRDEMTGITVAAAQTTFPGDFSLDPVSPYLSNWILTASMPHARYRHSATMLRDSRVLISGGADYTQEEVTLYYDHCTIYDPDDHVWDNTGSMNNARASHRSVLLADGRVLVCGGSTGLEGGSSALSSCEIFDPESGTWSFTGNMSRARVGHTAVLLKNGSVLVTGGYNRDDGYLDICEVYDPETGMWHYTGSLNQARWSHAAALLDDGTVLTIGGYYEDEVEWEILKSCELYDPDTGTFTLMENELNSGRSGPALIRLMDGRIAVFGGYAGSGYTNQNCEIYDPGNGTWTQYADMIMERMGYSATLLPNGEVLIAGGNTGEQFRNFCELFDPRIGSYSYTDEILIGRNGHTDTLLHDGTVLVTGGFFAGGIVLSSCELYEIDFPEDTIPPVVTDREPSADENNVPVSNNISFTIRDPLPVDGSFYGVDSGSITVTVGGVAAISGGDFQEGFEGLIIPDGTGGFYITIEPEDYFTSGQEITVTIDADDLAPDPNTMDQEQYSFTCTGSWWSFTGDLNQERSNHTATLLTDGTVLAAGGSYNYFPLLDSELYDPGTGNWVETVEDMNMARHGHTATLLNTDEVLVAGGFMGEWQTESCELYDPDDGTWTETAVMNMLRSQHTATLLTDGTVLVTGGHNGEDYLDSCEIYDPATGEWTDTGDLNQPRSLHRAALLADGSIMVIGGSYEDEFQFYALSSCEVYDPVSGTWSTLEEELNTGRSGPDLAVLADGRLLVIGGFLGSGMWTSSCEIYDPGAIEPGWESTESMITNRIGGYSTVFDPVSNLVIVTGGSRLSGTGPVYLTECELYDPDTETWSETSALTEGRSGHRAIVLQNGMVLVSGGYNDEGYLSSCELYETKINMN